MTKRRRPTPNARALARPRNSRLGLLLALAASAMLVALAVSPVQGANLSVNSTADQSDANPGDGLCATGAGVCTLRAAIQEANALPGADTITLPPGVYSLGL